MEAISTSTTVRIAEYTLLFACLCFIAHSTYIRYKPGLHDIPGPPLASWTNLWRFYDVWKGKAHETDIELHRKYGSLVRVGPNAVSVSDPAMIPVIYNTQGTFTKTAFYPIQSITWHKKVQLNIFSVRDETRHRIMKRNVAAAYTTDALLRMESAIDECGDLLIHRMRESALHRKLLDLGSWLHYYTFDVVGVITYGEKLGFLESGSDVDGLIAAGPVMMVPILHSILLGNPALPYLIPQLEAANHGVVFAWKTLLRRTQLSSEGKLQPKGDQKGDDMMSRWAAVNSRDPEKMSMTDVMVALTTNIFAGSDTTAISLRATLYYLMKNPQKMQEAFREIDDASQAGKLSDSITDHESREHLPYVNAAIREALRLHPATGLLLERHVPDGGATICGKHLPGGTIVGINSWTVHRDPEVFPEPEAFKPERWLAAVSEQHDLARMEKSFFAFGAGSRLCMGRNLSLIELRKIVPRILRDFKIQLEENAEWKVHNAWFTPQEMPLCTVESRGGVEQLYGCSTIQGTKGHLINMGGEQWWDGEGSNGGKTKPKGFYAHCFSVNGASNLQINDVTIDNSEGDGDDGGHNTDAFDIGSSSGVYISGANVKNQDDCVAINSGTDISFTGGTCSGGHGLSIGSVGGRDNNDVANVVFSDSTVSGSMNGVRIKAVSGATGSIKNITYSGIALSGISEYGIVIEQDYENGSPNGTPTDGVPITDVTLSDITGSVSSDASPYYILCASCSDWTVTGVDVTGGSKSDKCTGEPSGVSLC